MESGKMDSWVCYQDIKKSGGSVTMFMNHQPVVGNWYMNKTGKLLKVKMLMYADTLPSSVVIEYLDGSRQIVDYSSWSCLELHRHAQETTQLGMH